MENELIVDTKIINNNIKKIIKLNSDYKYHLGVVKANCYGLGYDKKIIKAIINGGINYLVVYNIEEALMIRKDFKNIPILCLEPVVKEKIKDCIKNNITITISNLEYLQKITGYLTNKLKVHIRISTGFIGIMKKDTLLKIYNILTNKKIIIEGIYTHIYDENNLKNIDKQLQLFKDLISNIDYQNIKIIHVFNGTSLLNSKKPHFVNGFRIGSIMYGFNKNSINLKLCLKYKTKIVDIRYLKKGENLGYDNNYTAQKDEYIGIIPVGYYNGFVRANKNNYVYIKNKKYYLAGNICMCESFIKIDKNIKIDDEVIIIKDLNHLLDIADKTNTIPEEPILSIKNVNTITK